MSLRVLVIEDDALMREAVELILRSVGLEIEGAASGEDGVARASANTPDLVLLDVNLPKINGVETLRRLRRANLAMPVLMLTADNSADTLRDVIAAGGNGYILKPFEPQALIDRVQTTLKGVV